MSKDARLAPTSRAWLLRMALTAFWYSPKEACSSVSLARMLASSTRPTRSGALPCSRPCSVSRKVLVSLPSRNATSGLTTSSASMVLAFFASRCVSIVSCEESAFCCAEPPLCTLSAAISSVISCSGWLVLLIERTAPPSATRFFSSSSTSAALRSVLPHSLFSSSSAGRTAAGVGGRLTPPLSPPASSSLISETNSSRPARNSLNASTLPREASCAALARRCDSMRILPALAM
jgi:hypothetical protein